MPDAKLPALICSDHLSQIVWSAKIELRGGNVSLEEDIEMYGRISIGLETIESGWEFAALIPEFRTNLVYARPMPGPVEKSGRVRGH